MERRCADDPRLCFDDRRSDVWRVHCEQCQRKRKNGRSNGKYSGSNAEVAYVLNYGSPRIDATHWLEIANEEAEDDVIAAEQEAWNGVVSQKGL